MDDKRKTEEGWSPPLTNAEILRRLIAKHGDNDYTRTVHRKWNQVAHEAGLTWR